MSYLHPRTSTAEHSVILFNTCRDIGIAYIEPQCYNPSEINLVEVVRQTMMGQPTISNRFAIYDHI
jgi:hypothetical protein